MKISTSPTSQNIAKILEILTKTPNELTNLADRQSSEEIYQPLGQGEWSFYQVLMHLHHCTDVSSVRIFYALMLDNPTIPVVHPERDWGNLTPYQSFSTQDLLKSY